MAFRGKIAPQGSLFKMKTQKWGGENMSSETSSKNAKNKTRLAFREKKSLKNSVTSKELLPPHCEQSFSPSSRTSEMQI